MERIVLTDGSGRWFAANRAQKWSEETYWNGSNRISLATGSQWEHEALYRTAGGVYVLNHWSQWQGSHETYTEISAAAAAVWLSRNEYGTADALAALVSAEYAALEIR